MLARYLALNRGRPVRYAQQTPMFPGQTPFTHPLHLLASGLLASPHLEHIPLLFNLLLGHSHNRQIPPLWARVQHGGEHGQFPALMRMLGGNPHLANPDQVRTLLDRFERLQAYANPLGQPPEAGLRHPLLQAYTPGSDIDQQANRHAQSLLATPGHGLGRQLRGLVGPERGALLPLYEHALHTGDLGTLLHLHHAIGLTLGHYGHAGPAGDLFAALRRPLQENMDAREALGDLTAHSQDRPTNIPEDMTPEDYHALGM